MHRTTNILKAILSFLLLTFITTTTAIPLDLQNTTSERRGPSRIFTNPKFHNQPLCKVIQDNALTTITVTDGFTSDHPQLYLFDSDCKLMAFDPQPHQDILAHTYNFAAGVLPHPLGVHYDSSSFFVNFNGRDYNMDWYAALMAPGYSATYDGPGWSMKTFPFPGKVNGAVREAIAASRANATIHGLAPESQSNNNQIHTLSKRHDYWGLGLHSPMCRQIDVLGVCTFTIVDNDAWTDVETYVFSSWCDPIGFEPSVSRADLANPNYEYLMWPSIIGHAVGVHQSANGWVDLRQTWIDYRGWRYDLFSWDIQFLQRDQASSYNLDGYRFIKFSFECNYA